MNINFKKCPTCGAQSKLIRGVCKKCDEYFLKLRLKSEETALLKKEEK